jgi:hypothetical protein
MSLRQLHRLAGAAAMLLFLGTGLIMHYRYDHLRGMSDTTRLLFRSTHIYLLFTALLNGAMGVYLTPAARPAARRLQAVGSILLLASPMLALAAFLSEPFLGGLLRPWSRPAIFAALGGVALHWLASLVPTPAESR